MTLEALIDYCLTKPHAREAFPFDETTLVFNIEGRMFALIDLTKADAVNLKCEPAAAIDLRERYEGIIPGWHMNKKHWNTVVLQSDVPDKLLRSLVDQSYDLVVKKLPKNIREKL